MTRLKIASALTAAACLFALCGSSLSLAARPAMAKDQITVKITTSNGTTWGKVMPQWKGTNGKTVMGAVCKKASCSYLIPHMTKITLTESATHPNTWPFKKWSVSGAGMGKTTSMNGKRVKFEAGATGKATATAVYTAM